MRCEGSRAGLIPSTVIGDTHICQACGGTVEVLTRDGGYKCVAEHNWPGPYASGEQERTWVVAMLNDAAAYRWDPVETEEMRRAVRNELRDCVDAIIKGRHLPPALRGK